MRWILILFFLVSCSSKYTSPPESEFIKSLYEGTHYPDINKIDENQRQASVYIRARSFARNGKNYHACQRNHYLERDKSFPLAKLSTVKTIKYCKQNKSFLEDTLKSYTKEFPEYLHSELLENILYQAQLKNYHNVSSLAALDLVKFKDTRKEKLETYNLAIKEAKLAKDAGLIERSAEERIKEFPRFTQNVEREDYYKVARDFERNRSFKRARKYYLKIINSTKFDIDLRIKAYYRYAFTFKLQRDKDTYTAKLKNMVWWIKKLNRSSSLNLDNEYIRYTITFARATWTQQNLSEGKKRLLRLLKTQKNIPESFLQEIYFVLGKMEMERKKLSYALNWFKKGSALNEASEDYKERFFWSLSWSYYLNKNYKEARAYLYSGIEKLESIFTKRKFKFWLAKSFQKDGLASEAEYHWKELWKEDPYGYYGIVSRIELNEKFPEIDTDINEFDPPNKELSWLLALDELEYAKKYLETNKRIHESMSNKDSLELFFHSGWFEGALFYFFKLKPEVRDETLTEVSPIIFPSPFQEKLSFVSAKEKVPLELIYSIMRQESAFNPTIRSWADAFGLMQITPERAQKLSSRYKIPYNDFSDLYSPETNVLFGSKILNQLMKEHQNNFIAYVASYNASSRVVKRWMKQKHRKDPLEFIEMIPYEETKGYVKLVFRNFVTYNRLHKGEFEIDKSFLYTGKLTD